MRLALTITAVSLIGCFHSKSIGEDRISEKTRKQLLENSEVARQNLVGASQKLVDEYGQRIGVNADLAITIEKLTPVLIDARKKMRKNVKIFQKNSLPVLKKDASELVSEIESKSPVQIDSIGFMIDDIGLEAFKSLKFVPNGFKQEVGNLIEEGMKTLKNTMEKRKPDVDWDNTDPQDVVVEAKNTFLEGFKQSKFRDLNKLVVDLSEKAVAGSQVLNN